MSLEMFHINTVSPTIEKLYAHHHLVTRIIYITTLIVLACGLFLLPIIKVDISNQSPGIITSHQENNRVTSMVYGHVNQVMIHENKKVSIGDTLLIINSSTQDHTIKTNKIIIGQNRENIHDLTQLLNAQSHDNTLNLTTSKYWRNQVEVQEKVSEFNIRKEFLQREVERDQKLYKVGALARAEYEKKFHDLNLIDKSVINYLGQKKKQWQLERDRYSKENLRLKSQNELSKKEKLNYLIEAPISGFIKDFNGINPGNYIVPNEQIALITSNDSLLVESYISTADIGLIQKGMQVKYQIDAFNYNQWGLATGIVSEIAPDIINFRNRPVFLVKNTLDQLSLNLSTKYIGKLKKGMTLTARYHIAQRSLYQLLFDRVDDWLNPKQYIEGS